MYQMYELFFADQPFDESSWSQFLKEFSSFYGHRIWKLFLVFYHQEIHVFVLSKYYLDSQIRGVSGVSFRLSSFEIPEYFKNDAIYLWKEEYWWNFFHKYQKKKKKIFLFEVSFFAIQDKIYHRAFTYYRYKNFIYRSRLHFLNFSKFFDFSHSSFFIFSKTPKYLKVQKQLIPFSSSKTQAVCEINGFPYRMDSCYLHFSDYDFFKHSFIIGASGSGKSKFLCSFIQGIFDSEYHTKYKFLVIDPHAALIHDIGGLSETKVIDFFHSSSSVNLLQGNAEDYVSNTELYLSLFQTLMKDKYNTKMERVLRYSIQLMLQIETFSFSVFRKLLLDSTFRFSLLQEHRFQLNDCVLNFFYQDYQELKSTSYGEAIAPILSFLDEMEMSPAFDQMADSLSLERTLEQNFLTLVSFNRIKLGDNVSKMLAGFVMLELLNIATSGKVKEPIIFIVDEVAVVENPILDRFLSEARKYGICLILVSQFFHQISSHLQESILANVINYYTFRISPLDAKLLESQLNLQLGEKDSFENRIQLLTTLKEREGIFRVSQKGKLLKGMQIKTLDFESVPYVEKSDCSFSQKSSNSSQIINFCNTSTVSLHDILVCTSASHREVNHNE